PASGIAMRAHCLALIIGLLGAASVNAQPFLSGPKAAPDANALPLAPPGHAAPGQERLLDAQPAPPPTTTPVDPSLGSPEGPAWPANDSVDDIDHAPSLPTQEATADPYLIWGRADFLLWWIKDGPAPPPLLTTGPPNPTSAAVLGQPGTTVIFGERPIDYGTFSGGLWSVGAW